MERTSLSIDGKFLVAVDGNSERTQFAQAQVNHVMDGRSRQTFTIGDRPGFEYVEVYGTVYLRAGPDQDWIVYSHSPFGSQAYLDITNQRLNATGASVSLTELNGEQVFRLTGVALPEYGFPSDEISIWVSTVDLPLRLVVVSGSVPKDGHLDFLDVPERNDSVVAVESYTIFQYDVVFTITAPLTPP